MAITLVNVAAQAANNSSPQSPAIPTNTTTNDLMLLICLQSSAAAVTYTPPAGGGWSSIARNSNVTRAMTLEVFAKTAGASETAPSVACSAATAGWAAQIATFRGVNNVVIEDQADVSSDSAAAGTWQPTGISTNTANAWVLSVVGSKDDNALNFSVANGYTADMSGANYDNTLGNGSDYSVGLAHQEFASTGAKTCPTWNQSVNGTDAWVGLTLALLPAIPVAVSPTKLALTTATFAPAVAVSNNIFVSPSKLALTLSTFAPSVVAINPVTLSPVTKALTLSTFAPAVTVSQNIFVTPTKTALTLSTFAPSINTGGATATTSYTPTYRPRRR